VKSWIAIPVVAAVAAAIAFAIQEPPETACAIAALAAALAAVVRAFVGGSAAATVASTVAALLGALFVLELHDIARDAFAAAAALFVISEIVRPQPVDASPLPSIGASLIAGVLDPSYIALVPVVGIRFILGAWSVPRGSVLLPIVGVLATGLAILAAAVPIPELWQVWTGNMGFAPSHNPLQLAEHVGEIVGPIAAVAAIAGFGTTASRGNYAIASVAAIVIGAVAVDIESGGVGVATLACAAFGAGLGIARLTAMLRWPAGQAAIGAAAGFMMLVAPALTHWLY
jgi:hypothetical protein